MSKTCSVCKQVKEFSAFYKAAKSKTGFGNRCKTCELEYQRGRKEEKQQASAKWWGKKGKEVLQLKRAKTKQKQLEKTAHRLAVLALTEQTLAVRWRKHNASRRFARKKATPVWVDSEHTARISSIYALTQQLQEATASIYHVDHIVPLISEQVCGLHVWWNLQPLSEKANIVKNNVFDPSIFPEQGEIAFPLGNGPTPARYAELLTTEESDDDN